MKQISQIVLSIFLILLLTNIPFAQSTITFNKNSFEDDPYIYVDGANTKGPWIGNQLFPYQTITDAYNASTDNDIIIVNNGIYIESLTIKKSITIVGIDQNETIIQSKNNHTIFSLNTPNISLSNLTFQNAGAHVNDAAVTIKEDNMRISFCTFHHAKTGIQVQNQKNIQIDNCLFYQTGDGIFLNQTLNTTIENSLFTHNSIGIHIEKSHNITVLDSYHFVNGIGIFLTDSSKCSINHCGLFNNNDNRGGIFMEKSNHIMITNSIIQHNGFGVKTDQSDSIFISKSTFQWNTHIGVSMFEQSTNIQITNCNFTRNLRYSVRGEKSDFIINQSNFDQSLYGLYNEESNCQIAWNWWGSTLGPTFFEQPQRQRISFSKETLSFYPWLQSPNKRAGADWTIPQYITNLGINFSIPIRINFNELDSDNDTIPDWWEIKYHYNPNSFDNHYELDPDKDGLSNVQECYASSWGSDPYRKDIFLEFDWMQTKTTGETNKPSIQEFSEIIDSFAEHNISLHIDLGSLGSGEQIPYKSHFNYAQLQDYYWNYFLHNNMNNPRKGIFHYGLICDYGPSPGFAVIGWDHLDSFCISAEWLKDNQPNRERQNLIIGGSIHELGHTLGLTVDDFGGNDNTVATQIFNKQWFKYLPYKSCMNYWYTYKILTFSDGNNGEGDFDDWSHMDLSFFSHTHFDLPDRYR